MSYSFIVCHSYLNENSGNTRDYTRHICKMSPLLVHLNALYCEQYFNDYLVPSVFSRNAPSTLRYNANNKRLILESLQYFHADVWKSRIDLLRLYHLTFVP